MKEFYLDDKNHNAIFCRVLARGLKAEDHYRTFFNEDQRRHGLISYQVQESDMRWVMDILEEDLRKYPVSETTETSVDTLVSLWKRVMSAV